MMRSAVEPGAGRLDAQGPLSRGPLHVGKRLFSWASASGCIQITRARVFDGHHRHETMQTSSALSLSTRDLMTDGDCQLLKSGHDEITGW